MSKGTHDYAEDPRNADIQISINGEYFTWADAKISVFDSGFILGDGVWEHLQVLHRLWKLMAGKLMKVKEEPWYSNFKIFTWVW